MGKNQFTNITENGLQNAGVPERADGVLLFVRLTLGPLLARLWID